MKKRGYLKPKVLITGNRGFIGTNLTGYLIARGYDVKGWNTEHGQNIFDSYFEDAVKKTDIVVHLAAKTSVPNSFKNPKETFHTNVLGTARVVEFCMKYNKKLIFPSSASIFHEELSPYAKSKKMAEEIVKEYNNAVILRFYNVFGPKMNPQSGSIMYNFMTAKKQIFIYGDGEQTRDFIHVKDIVRIIEDSFKKKWNGKIVDVGTGQAYSVNYVAGLFSHYRNVHIEYKPPQREIKWSIADTTLLKLLYKKPLLTNIKEDIENLFTLPYGKIN